MKNPLKDYGLFKPEIKWHKFFLIMKVSAFLLFFCLLNVFAIPTYSKVTKISLNFKDATLEEVLNKIEDESEFNFQYNQKLLDVTRKVNIKANKKLIVDILADIFKDETKFIVYDRQIILTPGDLKSSSNTIQQLKIAGTVTGKDGTSLPGVNVVVQGTTIGSITDINGRYTISVPNASSTLQFSFIGYVTQEIIIGGQAILDVVLISDVAQLSEVVVVGYGTQKKVNLTGAVTQVNSKVLESRPITNIGQGLQGVIANLNVDQGSGAMGREATFNIRGNTSINGGSPLVLVDGVEMDANLLNPQDIQSITVLKDAASASIYGARAAYGVMLVTTKNGMKNKKPVVSLSMDYTINKPTVVPQTMNSLDWCSWINNAAMTSYGIVYFDAEFIQHMTAYYEDPVNNSAFFQHSKDAPGILRNCANTEWFGLLLRDSYPMKQYTASITGGTDKITYYTSFGMLNQQGISKPVPENDKFDRFNLTQNISYDVNKWINLRAKITYNKTLKNMNPSTSENGYGGDFITAAYCQWPIQAMYAPDGNYSETVGFNTVAYLKEGGYQREKKDDLWLTGALKLTPVKGLIVNLDYTYNTNNANSLNYQRQYYTEDNNSNLVLAPFGNISAVTRTDYDNKYVAFNAYAEYEKLLGKHTLKLLVGFNQEYGGNSGFQAERQTLINNDIPYMILATGDQFAYDAASEYAIRGVFSRLNYSFDNRYLIELNARSDGSSRFPKNDRFAFFPSMSVGWRISNENFFNSLKNVIGDLKLRASYGNLGNQAVSGYYPYIATYQTGEVPYMFGASKQMTVYAPGLVSPTLTWEQVSQYNFGLDFAILDDKLSGSFDIYQRETKDMLAKSKSLPSVLATGEPQSNAANMKTNGFEFTLSWRQSLANGFKYGLNLILSDYTATITKYDNPKGILSDYYVGQKLGEIWGFESEGLYKTNEEVGTMDYSAISQHKFLAGDLKFTDLNNDNKITPGSQTLTDHGDLKIIGNSTPRYSYGFKADATWKGFDFAIFFQGVLKRDVLPSGMYFLKQYSNQYDTPQQFNNDYWRPDNQDAFFPRARIGDAKEVLVPQSHFLQNAAYIRLKQLTLGYSIPKELTGKINVDIVRIYFSGNNLWEATKMLNVFDPEASATNLYPLSRSYSFGVNISF